MHPVFLDGQWGTTDDMKVSVLDRGYLFGDGVYEVYRLYGRAPFTRELHLARLDRSLRGLDLFLLYSKDEFRRILDQIESRSPEDAYVYIHVTRGVAPRRHSFPETIKPSLMVMAVQLGPFAPALHRNGIGLRSQVDDRWSHCAIKSLNLLANCQAMTAANREGCFEALLVGHDGLVNESAASSFFAVVDGVVRTAPLSRNILAGVTRTIILELCADASLRVEEQAVTLGQALAAPEAFITNSVFEILPVAAIDGRAIGDGRPGQVTRRLMGYYAEKVARETGGRAVVTAALD
ncbi:MAG: aminotransferase class IV [Bacillota bacterium]|nr:aminotransferase class IV [Bacillota bacterium]